MTLSNFRCIQGVQKMMRSFLVRSGAPSMASTLEKWRITLQGRDQCDTNHLVCLLSELTREFKGRVMST